MEIIFFLKGRKEGRRKGRRVDGRAGRQASKLWLESLVISQALKSNYLGLLDIILEIAFLFDHM